MFVNSVICGYLFHRDPIKCLLIILKHGVNDLTTACFVDTFINQHVKCYCVKAGQTDQHMFPHFLFLFYRL